MVIVTLAPALLGGGPVHCWGNSLSKALDVPFALRLGRTARIVASSNSVCAVEEGTAELRCWGGDGSLLTSTHGHHYTALGNTPAPSQALGYTFDDVPAGFGPAGVVAGGRMGICAVRLATNTTVCFGRGFPNGGNQPPPELGRASAITVGTYHACGIQEVTGTTLCWEYRYAPTSATNVPEELGRTVAVAAGDDHTCAVQAETARLFCWGSNTHGQIPNSPQFEGLRGGGWRSPLAFGRTAMVVAGYLYTCTVSEEGGGVRCRHGTGVVTWSGFQSLDAALLSTTASIDTIVSTVDHACAVVRDGGACTMHCFGGCGGPRCGGGGDCNIVFTPIRPGSAWLSCGDRRGRRAGGDWWVHLRGCTGLHRRTHRGTRHQRAVCAPYGSAIDAPFGLADHL